MRKLDNMLKDYVGKLSTENLKFLADRLGNRMSGDMAEACDFISNHNEIDKWLSTAKSCMEFYDMLDLLQEYTEREFRKRVPDVVVSV